MFVTIATTIHRHVEWPNRQDFRWHSYQNGLFLVVIRHTTLDFNLFSFSFSWCFCCIGWKTSVLQRQPNLLSEFCTSIDHFWKVILWIIFFWFCLCSTLCGRFFVFSTRVFFFVSSFYFDQIYTYTQTSTKKKKKRSIYLRKVFCVRLICHANVFVVWQYKLIKSVSEILR